MIARRRWSLSTAAELTVKKLLPREVAVYERRARGNRNHEVFRPPAAGRGVPGALSVMTFRELLGGLVGQMPDQLRQHR